jgi:hypothetical protein
VPKTETLVNFFYNDESHLDQPHKLSKELEGPCALCCARFCSCVFLIFIVYSGMNLSTGIHAFHDVFVFKDSG